MTGRTKGFGPFRYDWFSFCSAHQEYDKSCNICQEGRWANHYTTIISSLVYKIFPKFWRWWMNR